MPRNELGGLYTGGAVQFNTAPSVNFYAQLLAKQQAKKDALNQYYQKAISDVTPAGMRNIDITNGFSKKLNDWQEFALNPENRKYLENPRLDGYKATTRFNQMHSDLMADIQRSKEAAANEKTLDTLRTNGKWNPTDDDMEVAHKMGLSIYDQNRRKDNGQDYDIGDLSVNVPQFTPLQEKQLYQSAIPSNAAKTKIPDTTKQRIDRQSGMIYTPFTKQYTTDQIKNISDVAAANLDRSAQVHYEQLMHDPNIYDAATQAYQKVYGANQLIDSPQKMAKGIMAIHALSDVETGEDKAQNYAQREADVRSHIRLAHILSGNDAATINQNVDSIIKTDIENANNNDGVVPTTQAKFKALTGQNYNPKLDVLKIDGNGNYSVFKKTRNPDTGELTETLTKVSDIPYMESKTSLTKNWKTGLSGDYNTGTNAQPKASKMIMVVLPDGRKGQIPENKVNQFLKENKGAKRQ